MDKCLIIFAKEPSAGRVKTRLGERIGLAEAAEIYKAFVKDTLSLAKEVSVDRRILAYASEDQSLSFLSSVGRDFELYPQKGFDLGERMCAAFQYGLGCKADQSVVIIGSDSPTLPASFIEEAYDCLRTADLVLGPSQDGGYYLIGLRRAYKDLFCDIAWSSPDVLVQTKEKALKLNLAVSLLPSWQDVDSYEDFQALKKSLLKDDSARVRHTREAVRKIN